jgi:hypothetical protein
VRVRARCLIRPAPVRGVYGSRDAQDVHENVEGGYRTAVDVGDGDDDDDDAQMEVGVDDDDAQTAVEVDDDARTAEILHDGLPTAVEDHKAEVRAHSHGSHAVVVVVVGIFQSLLGVVEEDRNGTDNILNGNLALAPYQDPRLCCSPPGSLHLLRLLVHLIRATRFLHAFCLCLHDAYSCPCPQRLSSLSYSTPQSQDLCRS